MILLIQPITDGVVIIIHLFSIVMYVKRVDIKLRLALMDLQ